MAKEHKHAKTYVCYDLNEVVDFSKKLMMKLKQW